jgi:tight adherence protein B
LTATVLAVVAGFGTYLVVTARLFNWRGLRIDSGRDSKSQRRLERRVRAWLTQAGFDSIRPRDLTLLLGALFMIGAALAFALFGGLLPALVAGVFAASFPIATIRQRRRARRAAANEAWPRMIEEIRILTGSVGRSIPQALFEAGRGGPIELRGAFEAAQREWLISTDFARTVAVLKDQLGDAAADAALETLLIANELGGSDLDRRLADLAHDRREDLQYRKDVRARQAGVRFARRFVLIVPLGMAVAGLSVGTGRAAYENPSGQLAVAVALVMIAGCWVWAGQLMRLPDEDRVFDGR